MCRARPGPRCSNTAGKRWASANDYFQAVKSEYLDAVDHVDENGGVVPPRVEKRYRQAQLRYEAAKKVYWASPAGHRDLSDQIERHDEEIARQNEHLATLVAQSEQNPDDESLRSRIRLARVGLDGERGRRAVLEATLAGAVKSREDSYRDLALVRDERSHLRRQNLARGGVMGPLGHPLSEEKQVEYRERMNLTPEPLELREWNDSDFDRASTWMDPGSTMNSFEKNWRLRPFSQAKDRHGNVVELGETVEGEHPHSRMIRLNTPDGQVVEGRHDVHLTQNAEGKYVVGVRSIVGASWEDASPIDKTQQELGHILAGSTVDRRAEGKYVVGVYDTLAAARGARTRTERDFDAAKTTAVMGRDVTMKRFALASQKPQRRGLPVWWRYREEDTPQEEAVA